MLLLLTMNIYNNNDEKEADYYKNPQFDNIQFRFMNLLKEKNLKSFMKKNKKITSRKKKQVKVKFL